MTITILLRRACVAAAGALLLSISGIAQAGTVVVSGDVTSSFFLTDTPPNSATAGNQQFFANVLGSGTSVGVYNFSLSASAASEVNTYYNGLLGVTSSLIALDFDASALSGLDLLVIAGPSPVSPPGAFDAAELSAISDFVSGSGSIFLMGEGALALNGAGADSNVVVNSVLNAVGSSMTIISDTSFDGGPQVASGSQIATNPLTNGVLSFNYGLTSGVTGGTPLFFTTTGEPFVAVEGVVPGVVPLPAALPLFVSAVAVLGFMARRRKRLSA